MLVPFRPIFRIAKSNAKLNSSGEKAPHKNTVAELIFLVSDAVSCIVWFFLITRKNYGNWSN